jgi:hypothetical protein
MKFDPADLPYDEISERLILGAGDKHLPDGWIAARLPRPALPVDIYLQKLLGHNTKRVLRDADDLRAQHPLGVCPFALARHGIAHAASHASYRSHKDTDVRPVVVEALQSAKKTFARLCTALGPAYRDANMLLEASEHIDLEAIPRRKQLAETMLVLLSLLPSAQPAMAGLHQELSQNTGDVYRLSFVRSLAGVWWQLAGADPSPSAGPFQEFVIAAWCSLSSDAASTDADWRSAIETAMRRVGDGEWRIPAQGKTEPRPSNASALVTAFDPFFEISQLEARATELRQKYFS